MKLEEYLNSIECITAPDGGQLDAVAALLEAPGMRVLLGLLLATKQGHMVILSNLPLATPEGQHRASVTQGIINGLDGVRQTLLELFPTTDGDPSNRGDN